MPQIPQIEPFQPENTRGDVRVNPNILDSEFEAASRMGEAVSDVGKVMERYAQEKQALVNEGDISTNRLSNTSAAEEVKIRLNEEMDHTKWLGITAEVWDARQKALGEGKFAPSIQGQLTDEMMLARNKSTALTRREFSQRGIDNANAALLKEGQTLWRNGQKEEAEARWRLMNMNPLQMEKMIQREKEDGAYYQVAAEIQETETLVELEEIKSGLTETKDGVYTEHPNMPFGGRLRAQRDVQAKIRQTEKLEAIERNAERYDQITELASEGDREGVVEVINSLEIPATKIQKLRENVLEDMTALASERAQNEIKTLISEALVNNEADTLESLGEDLAETAGEPAEFVNYPDLSEDGRVQLMGTINSKVTAHRKFMVTTSTGAIKAAAAGKYGDALELASRLPLGKEREGLIAQVNAISAESGSADEDSTIFSRFSGQIKKAAKWGGTLAFEHNREKMETLRGQIALNTDLNRPAKAELFQRLLNAEAIDISDGEIDVRDTYWDRNLNPGEQAAWNLSIRAVQKAIGTGNVNASVTPTEGWNLYNAMLKRIREDVANSTMDPKEAAAWFQKEIEPLIQSHIYTSILTMKYGR